MLGYTQAFSSLGGLLVTGAYYLAVRFGEWLPEIHGGHEAWRYTLISGVFPALPLIVIRPFLPESPAWKRKRAEGTLVRPSLRELFRPALEPGASTYDVPNGVGVAIGMTFVAGLLFSVLPGWLLDPVLATLN